MEGKPSLKEKNTIRVQCEKTCTLCTVKYFSTAYACRKLSIVTGRGGGEVQCLARRCMENIDTRKMLSINMAAKVGGISGGGRGGGGGVT